MAVDDIFKITFLSHGQVYEIYARSFCASEVWGFIEVEDFLFGEKTQVVLDPSEEKLKGEFEGVKRTYLPMHAVLRIDQVAKEGHAKITDAKGGNVTPFPMAYPQRKDD